MPDATFTQENRQVRIDTPLGDDVLLLSRFDGTEAVSSLFHYQLELLSTRPDVAFDDIAQDIA